MAVPEGGKFYCSARDITDDKERAQALQDAEAALRQAQKKEAIGQLTGGIAHDFNNLLAAIGGSFEVIEKCTARSLPENVPRFVAIGQGAVRRGAALTHRLLAFSRQQALDARPTDVNRLVASMEELIRRTVGPAVQVEVIGAAGLWPTLVDRNQLENALLNLCINARDAMSQSGRLTIATANTWIDERAALERDLPAGRYVTLRVTDDGVGMTAEVAAKAFDPFFTTKPPGAGTGLGLSMVYGFARQSGGQVRIDSEPGNGTTMCVYLPRHTEGPAEPLPETVPDRMTSSASGEVVLVVEDEEAVQLLLVEVLEEAGYAVLEAADGASGLRALEAAPRIDLLVTDIGLPGGLDGRQLAERARIARPGLKVLLLTGYADNTACGNARLEPGTALITKPFELAAIARAVRGLIEGEERR